MFLLENRVIYSASDLTAAATCEWALMRRLDAKLGRIDAVEEPEDEMLRRTAALGDVHEQRTLEQFKLTRTVVEFTERPEVTELAAAAAQTERALRDGADALYQATFFDGRFLGYADFILRGADGGYEVYDTKLARRAKVTALMQLAAYSEQLQQLGIPTGETVYLLLGDGRTSEHRLRDILPVYRKRRARLEAMVDERVEEGVAAAWADPRFEACGRCAACTEQVELHRDVLLVAGMRRTQRAKLNAAGIATIDQLAEAAGPITGMSDAALTGLRAQARLQIGGRLDFEVVEPAALTALPQPDPGDIFFDFEGDPLYQEGAAPTKTVWGLDYLFGLVEPDETFRAFWAHDLAEERQALLDFLAYVDERRTRYPGMHIYHYASYERTHLLSIAARHGVGEEAVDDLLRNHVLVDLYPVVRQGLRIGTRSYSLKKLEPLYMGDDERHGVANAADSITEYVHSRELFAAGETDAAQLVLDDIASYNTYDCVSTLRLRDWLLARAAENAVDLAVPAELPIPVPLRDPDPVYVELTALLAEVPPAERSADHTALALASAAIDYHRREQKSFWWDHFTRLRAPVSDWADTRDVLVIDQPPVVVEDWHLSGRQKLARRILSVTGTLAPGSKIGVGSSPYVLYDPPFPPITPSSEPGARTTHNKTTVLDIIDESIFIIEEKLEADAPQHQALPMALTPAQPPNAGTQVEAISEWGRRVLSSWPEPLPDAAFDILRRVPPRSTRATGTGDSARTAGSANGGSISDSIRDDLLSLDRSYLAVQGPPGTGKTYTGSRVIADLVANHGWKVGVVAQSHAAVENMLRGVLDAGLDPSLVGKKPKNGDGDHPVPWTPLDGTTIGPFAQQSGGFVLGGTAWDFSHAGRVPRSHLDLLVIDEAGQYSLASTIAAAVAAQRLLLLGDPQQLPQVSQGTHPEPVDVSALGWLTDGHRVLPPELGYFLATSWRMHPAVCAPVSALSYEDKLRSHHSDRHLDGIEPGVHPVAVPHAGNSTSSDEEADAVVELVRSALGRDWSEGGDIRPLAPEDVIVVAPYNAQVGLIHERLRSAGLGRVPVGTVDKFQGREAAVAIVSMCASSADDVPRGLEFLLMPNRLNVAISRAQWAAFLVYSPGITEYLPHNVHTLADLCAFITLVEPAPVAAKLDA
ncbi:bifunctional RecB family nuclease/DEAD/DEAH box helicase [Salinibacterium sp. ZJ454]|uniref:TM0106 family RecB-like putative nuclease n=1 Tax=Salinibacterium sp. ZJ454 TaxID=2708339 RepID=UPI0014243BDA|nr:bifunctional RecB family nuclease/DEAD/DEAH box helicase [Salinibacterium sp. ZJ454]